MGARPACCREKVEELDNVRSVAAVEEPVSLAASVVRAARSCPSGAGSGSCAGHPGLPTVPQRARRRRTSRADHLAFLPAFLLRPVKDQGVQNSPARRHFKTYFILEVRFRERRVLGKADARPGARCATHPSRIAGRERLQLMRLFFGKKSPQIATRWLQFGLAAAGSSCWCRSGRASGDAHPEKVISTRSSSPSFEIEADLPGSVARGGSGVQ